MRAKYQRLTVHTDGTNEHYKRITFLKQLKEGWRFGTIAAAPVMDRYVKLAGFKTGDSGGLKGLKERRDPLKSALGY
jgi:hypothetical protein